MALGCTMAGKASQKKCDALGNAVGPGTHVDVTDAYHLPKHGLK